MRTATSSTPIRPANAFLGRETLIDEVVALLERSDRGIVTLIGPAGVGKTRLAIEILDRYAADRTGESIWLDLAPVGQADRVLPMLLAALGLSPDDDVAARTVDALAGQRLWIVLDNFEHVLEAGPAINALLQRADDVRILVTSQAPLRVAGERVVVVPPLSLPALSTADPRGAVDLDRLAQSPAVRLFVDRSRAVRPGFALTDSNAHAVATVCQLLDGLPLAIELAAARSNVLSPAALLARLLASERILRGGPRDALERHRALETAIQWSFDLLDPDEAALLDRLSVFSGNFSLAAAIAVAGGGPIQFDPSPYISMPSIPPLASHRFDTNDTLDILERLIDRSLVQRVDPAGPDPAFRLLGTIRRYAADRLDARGDTSTVRHRHAAWYWHRAESTWAADGSPRPEFEWLHALDADAADLRSALDWFTVQDPSTAAVMASALLWYLYLRGRRMEAVRMLERLEPAIDPATMPPAAVARIEFAYATVLTLFDDRRAEGIQRLERFTSSNLPAGTDWLYGYALMVIGVMAETEGDFERVLQYVERAQAALERFEDTSSLANLDYHRALALFGLGRIDESRVIATRLTQLDPTRAGMNIVYARHLLGFIGIASGDQQEAARQFRLGLEFTDDLGVLATVAEAFDGTAAVAAMSGEYELVAELFGAADRLNDDLGNPITFPEKTFYDAARDAAIAAIGADRFAERYDRGTELPREAAFDLIQQTLARLERGDRDAAAADRELQDYGLTEPELAVLRLVALGSTDRQVARELGISYATARMRLHHILGKLGVKSRTAATALALRTGLVVIDEDR